MPDATRLLSDELKMKTSLHWNKNRCFSNGWQKICDRYENRLRTFQLIGTRRYKAISLPDNRLWLEELELRLGLWQGYYQQTTGLWLRWYNAAGWVSTRKEKAE